MFTYSSLKITLSQSLLLALLLLLLAACTTPQAAARPRATRAPEAATCPTATADTWLLEAPEFGYCLLYPLPYKVERTGDSTIELVRGTIMNHVDPRASIMVTPADGRSAENAADAELAAYSLPAGFLIRENISVAGEAAVVLDKLPGQNFQRLVFFVHDDLLYRLAFSPVHEEDPARDDATEALYRTVIDSFTFIERGEPLAERCLAPKPGMALLRDEAAGFCLLHPDQYTADQPVAGATVLYVGSLLDTEHPKLFIEVLDAGDETAADAAERLIADTPADFDLSRTFGVTLGHEIAEQVENVPGQDIGRVVFVVHDGRLYQLTFVPASPDAGAVYEEMEQLYDLVVQSFQFLPEGVGG